MYTAVHKRRNFYFFYNNFGKCGPIWIIRWLLHSPMNCRKSCNKIYHITSNVLQHFLEKFECSTVGLQLYSKVIQCTSDAQPFVYSKCIGVPYGSTGVRDYAHPTFSSRGTISPLFRHTGRGRWWPTSGWKFLSWVKMSTRNVNFCLIATQINLQLSKYLPSSNTQSRMLWVLHATASMERVYNKTPLQQSTRFHGHNATCTCISAVFDIVAVRSLKVVNYLR